MIKPILKADAILRRFRSSQEGSITVEAAIVLPAMIALVMFMVCLIQISVAELALRSAVSEAGKSVAGYWSPVRMVYSKAKAQVASSQAGVWAQEMMTSIESAHGQWTAGEEWVLQYEALLPESVVELVKWEVGKRQSLEQSASDSAESALGSVVDPLLCKALEPVLLHYANSKLLDAKQLSVASVRLPSLEEDGNPYLEITARYELKLPIPFFHKTIVLEKKSYERAWVGK